MIIDQEAWHLKLCRFAYGNEYQPRNLCKYFWSVVLAAPVQTIKGLVVGVRGLGRVVGRPLRPLASWEGFSEQTTERLATGLGGFVALAVASFITFLLVMGALAVGWWMLGGLGIGVGVIAAFIVVTAGLVQAITFINEHRPHMTAKPRVAKTPKPKKVRIGDSTLTIIGKFLWAKKKKMCPLIVVEEEA